MKRNNLLKAVVLGCAILILHSCGIPKVATQESNITLPTNYSEKVTQSDNSGKVRWKDFFEDKYLQSLIDSTLVNNKELNILMQKVNMAQNEIQARKGEYLPSVGLGAGADLDKVGKFTRNGAVEENLNIREDEKFPEPLTNYKFGLYSTWELDVWKKLRNSKKAAVMEYMASQEGKNYLVTNLVAEVANSYYELIALDAQLKNLEQNIEIQKNALEIVKLLKESARTTLLAVKRFEAEVQKNQSEIYNLKQEIVEVENKINFLVGRNPQPVLRDASNFMTTTPKFVNVGLPADLLENRPDIKQAQLELAQQLAELPRADFATKALGHSKAIVIALREDAIQLINAYAPEHLILSVDNALVVAEKLRQQGIPVTIQQIYNFFNNIPVKKRREILAAAMDVLADAKERNRQLEELLSETIE